MKTATQGLFFPDGQTYLNRLLVWTEQAMKRWEDCPLLTDRARQQAAILLVRRLEAVAGPSLRDLWELRMKEKNSLLALDIRLATLTEKAEAAQALSEELERSEDRLLWESSPMLRGETERCVERFARWLEELLDRVERHRLNLSDAFFGGVDFGRITGLTADQADLHFHGRSAAVVKTEKGSFLYKPHSCELEHFYLQLVERWFSDITCAPGVVQGNGYGFCEFIVGKPPDTREKRAAYFFNFGGLCAMFQALGSTDLHYENFIARNTYPILVDIETLFTPLPKVFNDPAIFPELPPQQEDFIADLNRSLYPSSLLPCLQHDTQMSPLAAETLPVLWGFEEDFFKGFSEVYDRCMELRDQLAEFLLEAEDFSIRKLLRQSSYYGQVLKRLYSPAALGDPKVQEKLTARLGEYFQHHGADYLQSIADWEAECLLEGDIPYFSCRGNKTDLLGYDQVVAKDFFRQSPLDNAKERLSRLNRQEKQFELALLRQSFESALRPIPKEMMTSRPTIESKEHPLDKAEAIAHAEEIFCELRDRAIVAPCGEVGWLMPEGNQGRFAYARPTLFQGTVGLGVFFAGIYSVTAHIEIKSQAKELCQAVLDQLSRRLEPFERAKKIPEELLPIGLSGGSAGLLKALVIMGRCLDHEMTDPIIHSLLSLLDKTRIKESKSLDVISGAAGLLQVLCGYEELRSDPRSLGLIVNCADKLLASKTLKIGSGRLLWDTMNLGRPISGMGHGIAGIGASLQMAGAILHREDCLLAAREALEWEHMIYSEKLKTWPDFRESSLGEYAMHGYCSGAPGVGLAMLLYGEWGEKGTPRQENLERARAACRQFPIQQRDHLCCGNSAAVEFLMETGRRLNQTKDVRAAGVRLTDMVARKEQLGQFCYLPPSYRDHFEPSLFYGAAGVGYELLRWADERLPSVLS